MVVRDGVHDIVEENYRVRGVCGLHFQHMFCVFQSVSRVHRHAKLGIWAIRRSVQERRAILDAVEDKLQTGGGGST